MYRFKLKENKINIQPKLEQSILCKSLIHTSNTIKYYI